MANFVQGYELRNLHFGTQVTKSWTLPASATTNTLFTVSGGLVAITGLVGQVTTLIGATTTTLALGLDTPGVGGTLDTDGLGTATGITSQEVGTSSASSRRRGWAAAWLSARWRVPASFSPIRSW